VRRLTAALFSLFALILPIGSEPSASELVNIFGSGDDEKARQANAQALDGLTSIFLALKDRELKDVQGSEAKLKEAAEDLRSAAAKMREVKAPEIQLGSAAKDPDLQEFAKFMGAGPPKTLAQLYNIFITETDKVAQFTAELAARTDESPIMPQIGPVVSSYIRSGDLVTRIASSLKH
jgi:hypothetical protein